MDEAIIQSTNIVYGQSDHELLTADTYKPKLQQRPLPVLVLVHGGAWQTGSKEMYTSWAQAFAAEGYFVMAINYRLAYADKSSFPGVLQDLNCAFNWLVQHSHELNLDTNKIGMVGDSAGAHLSALFTLKQQPFSYQICAVVGIYGIYDLIAEVKNPVSDRAAGMFTTLLGKELAGNEALYSQASPVTYISAAAARPTFDTSFYLVHGAQDKVVNPEQSRLFATQLRAENIEVQLEEIPDVGHFWFNQLPAIKGGKVSDYPNNLIYERMLSFLDKTVKNSASIQFAKRRLVALAASESLEINL